MAQEGGRLGKALVRLFMKRAVVAEVAQIGARFRLVTLEGPDLRNAAWAPGQKIQVAMGSAFVARTYTPIEWDAARGRTRILGYAHGAGPGSDWLRGLAPGGECDLFGPRASLDPARLPGPLALFGDETSIGLACSLVARAPAACHFEVEDAEAASQLLAQIGLTDAAVLPRQAGDAHLAQMESALPRLAASGASFVLTGKAGTVQRLRQALKRLDVPSRRILTKAYWAPGKAGLD